MTFGGECVGECVACVMASVMASVWCVLASVWGDVVGAFGKKKGKECIILGKKINKCEINNTEKTKENKKI